VPARRGSRPDRPAGVGRLQHSVRFAACQFAAALAAAVTAASAVSGRVL